MTWPFWSSLYSLTLSKHVLDTTPFISQDHFYVFHQCFCRFCFSDVTSLIGHFWASVPPQLSSLFFSGLVFFIEKKDFNIMIIVINILIEKFSIAAPVVSVIGLCDAILYKAAVLVFKLHLMTQISTQIMPPTGWVIEWYIIEIHSTTTGADNLPSFDHPWAGGFSFGGIFFLFFALLGEYFLSKKSSLTIFLCPSLTTSKPWKNPL